MTKELIGKLRELSDRVFHGDTGPGDFRIIDQAADALAARQPRESDRESLSQLIALGLDDTKNLGDWSQDYQDEMHQAADVILAAGFSRAAVPDAATENVQKMYERACADIQEYSETIKRLEAEVDDWREGWIIARLTKAEEERDAALAALVGAPEPEWEYSVGFNDPECGWINDHADIHDNYEDARSDYSEPHWLVEDRVVRRRKAGPWLPVEGEKP